MVFPRRADSRAGITCNLAAAPRRAGQHAAHCIGRRHRPEHSPGRAEAASGHAMYGRTLCRIRILHVFRLASHAARGELALEQPSVTPPALRNPLWNQCGLSLYIVDKNKMPYHEDMAPFPECNRKEPRMLGCQGDKLPCSAGRARSLGRGGISQ